MWSHICYISLALSLHSDESLLQCSGTSSCSGTSTSVEWGVRSPSSPASSSPLKSEETGAPRGNHRKTGEEQANPARRAPVGFELGSLPLRGCSGNHSAEHRTVKWLKLKHYQPNGLSSGGGSATPANIKATLCNSPWATAPSAGADQPGSDSWTEPENRGSGGFSLFQVTEPSIQHRSCYFQVKKLLYSFLNFPLHAKTTFSSHLCFPNDLHTSLLFLSTPAVDVGLLVSLTITFDRMCCVWRLRPWFTVLSDGIQNK